MKIVYLDQFVLKRAFCPVDNDPHRKFFMHVGELCIELAKKGVASFPFSESHLKETALLSDQAQKELIAKNFAAISNGYRFAPSMGVPQMQASAVRKGKPLDWSAQKVVYYDIISFEDILCFTERPGRDSHDALLKQVLMYWQSLPQANLDMIAKREAQTYVRVLTEEFAKIMKGGVQDSLALAASPFYRLFMELERDAMEDGVKDPITDAYLFICNRIIEVPCIRLASEIWQKFAKSRHQALHKVKDAANTAEDIEFISCFVPYCDAAFLDIDMTALLTQPKFWAGYKTNLFSLKHRKDKFIQYLSRLERDYVNPVSPKTFAAFETERLPTLRQHSRPLLWICFIPTHPDDLVRSKIVDRQNAPDSLIECRILSGGGIEWIEAIPDTGNISTGLLQFLIQRALDRIFAVSREGCHVLMEISYSLVNCVGIKIENQSALQSQKIKNNLFKLGVSDWLTDSRDLLWPKPDEILAALFQSKSPKSRTEGRRISSAPTGLG